MNALTLSLLETPESRATKKEQSKWMFTLYEYIWHKIKYRYNYQVMVSSADADALVLQRQAISIHSTDSPYIVLSKGHVICLCLWFLCFKK